MAVVFETIATATRDNDGGVLVVGKPAGTVENDVLVAAIAIDGWGTISGPAGWTKEVSNDAQPVGASTGLAVFWLVAGPAEPGSYTFTNTRNETAVGAISRYSGVDLVVTVEASALGSGGGSSLVSPSVTTLGTDRLIVRSAGQDGDRTPYTPPAGHSERYDLATVPGGSPTSGTGADALQVVAGPTGTGTFTASAGGDWRTGTIALVPAAVSLVAGAGLVTMRVVDFTEDWGRGSILGN